MFSSMKSSMSFGSSSSPLRAQVSIPNLLSSVIKNPNVVFAIPDVITSNTAPQKLLDQDPNAIVTENGVCYIDDAVSFLGGEAKYVSKKELENQWLAKLYIHNTPHCIAAYLGSIVNVTYLHESMQNKFIKNNAIGAAEQTGRISIPNIEPLRNYEEQINFCVKLNKTIIFATHNRELANRADYKLFISNGDIKRVNAR